MLGRGVLVTALVFVVACGSEEDPLRFGVTLEVVDDTGAPVAGATIDLGDAAVETDGAGRAELRGLTGPVMAIVSHDALLAEPVAVGRDDAGLVVQVRTWRREGGRWSLHSGGDVMLGRRYNAPPEGDPLIDRATAASDAVAIVEPVRRAFTASDARTFNLETVVADLPDDAKYPGKRFILQTWPETLAGVHALSPTVVISANNHGRDYLDEGVASTQAALAAEGLDFIGVTDGSGPALEPATFDVEGKRVGVLAWTTVDGAFVNDSYPEDGAPIPADVQDVDLWQYAPRSWGWTGAGGSIATAERRIGSAWRAFEALERDLSDDEVAEAWASMTAVYPEMQDWVARRGHGGAAEWVTSEATAMIGALAAETDVVVVQLHAGFQFQPAPSDYVRRIAQQAIDAGADVVICHHPHVLQGVEYYKGKLIAFSLGNFIFDQDFLSTFASGFLRTVWEGDRLVEARLVPIEIAAYHPTPVADDAARRSLLRVWEMSTLRAAAARGADNGIRVFTVEPDADTAPAHVRIEHHSAVFTPTPPAAETRDVVVDAGAIAPLPGDALVDPRLGLAPGDADLYVGRDIFGWGGFEDRLADGIDDPRTHWVLEGERKHVETAAGAADGVGWLRLERSNTNESAVLTRPVARVPMPSHRLYAMDAEGDPVPLDPDATYSLRARVRLTGDGEAAFRMDTYLFDDTNPTEDPSSTPIGQTTFVIDVPDDGQWHDVTIDIPADALEESGLPANMCLLNVRLGVPTTKTSHLDVDQLAMIEWRRAADMPDRFGPYELVRNVGQAARELAVPVLPAF